MPRGGDVAGVVGAFAGGQVAADQQPVPGGVAVAIHVCAHFPYPAKIWVNGHEYGT